MNPARLALQAVLVFAVSLSVPAAPPQLTLTPFASGLSSPVEIVHDSDPSGRRLFVVEQAGRIRVIRDGQLLPTPYLDISAANGGPVRSGGEQGLLGLAFHGGWFWVFYTRALQGDPSGNEIVIARYSQSLDPDRSTGVGSTVLRIPHPSFSNHNGGKLAFGPEGYLYIGVGDGGGGGDPFGAAQSLSDLRGKILRIDVRFGFPYVIPQDNPFRLPDPDVRWEIWAYGLRNPWRYSFDRATGDLLIGDVGQNAWEEINFEPSGPGGRNYGWKVFEGTHCFSPPSDCSLAGHTPPVIEYPHDSSGGFSVIGGYVYRGGSLPALRGYYVYGDFVTGRIWSAAPDTNGVWSTHQVATLPNLSTFGEDVSGELYAASLDGQIYRLTPPASTIPRLGNLSTRTHVFDGEAVVIAGFVVGGPDSKTVVITGKGPSLSEFGVSGVLGNPQLQLVRMSDQFPLRANDDWGSSPSASEITASGFAPSHALESAIYAHLEPGAYAAILSGVRGETGVGLVEVYEVDRPDVPLINLSTRARVLTGDSVMVGGFVILGDAPQTVVVTAKGPSLASHGVASPLPNPSLRLVRLSDHAVIATNDNWGEASNAADIAASGLAPTNAFESAILTTLQPGAYTAIVSGVGESSGVGIVEVYRQ